jgi:hypothetical protein
MIKIKQHKNLNPKIWNPDNTLKPEVLDTLLKITENFLSSLYFRYNITFDVNEIKDVFIYGSMANYFYTEKSDIDICIVLDLSMLRAQNPFINIENFLKMCYQNWKIFHHEKIYGYTIDISFDDVCYATYNGRHRAGPQYSLFEKDWIYAPVVISAEEYKKTYKEADTIYKAFIHDYKQIKKSGAKYEQLQILYKDIYAMKSVMYEHDTEQPITPVAIAWRRLRTDGTIDEMRKLLTKKRSEKLSLK